MESNDLTHPAATDRWWENEEEKGLLAAYQANFQVSEFLLTDHPRDSFMAMMVGIECFFKYAYAITRFNAINEVGSLEKVLRFLKISSPQINQYKCSVFKHDIGLVLSELRKRYANLGSHRDIQDFIMSLPPNETTSFTTLDSLSWMAFRYRDGNDPAIKTKSQQYITALKPKFQEIQNNFFQGLI